MEFKDYYRMPTTNSAPATSRARISSRRRIGIPASSMPVRDFRRMRQHSSAISSPRYSAARAAAGRATLTSKARTITPRSSSVWKTHGMGPRDRSAYACRRWMRRATCRWARARSTCVFPRASRPGRWCASRGKAGRLYLEVNFEPHVRFRVDGRDLYLKLPVAPWEAALGATIEVALPTPRHSLLHRP